LYLGVFVGHKNCEKFQRFLLDEFSRMFSMFSNMEKKETATSEKLLCALEKCDDLDYEVQRLRNLLSEFDVYEFDM